MTIFRTILRQPLEEGEMLSDSDKTCLTLQHNETLDDLLCNNRYVGDALLCFMNANKLWLGQKDLWREFAKKV